MFDYFWLWSEMIVRWVHVIAGVAWIGSSFYFIALDLSLKPGKELPKEANGQAWQVHGGGFYNMVKYHWYVFILCVCNKFVSLFYNKCSVHFSLN